MPKEDYALEHSSYAIYRGDNMDDNLEDSLEVMESDIASKAASNHTHTATQVGAATANHTHNEYAATAHSHSQGQVSGLEDALFALQNSITAAQEVLSGKAATSHTHTQAEIADLSATLTTLQNAINGKAASTHTHSYDDLDDLPSIPTSLPANGGNADTVDNKHASDFATSSHTHNYAASSHTHAMSAITGLLDVLMTDSYGGVKNEYASGDMLNIVKGWSKGVYTAYFKGGSVTNAPTDKESWRCLSHKTGDLFGWLLAFGTSGSVYNNYLDNGTWRGWRALYDANPAPLWGTSGYYMTAGHTVTPAKKLSECAHGWLLLWSDYDPDTGTSNEKDFWTTVIPNRTPAGAKWSSKLFYCDIPRYIGDNLSDTSTEKRVIKQIYISDDKIVGHDSNNKGDRTDVVLRAVYEF